MPARISRGAFAHKHGPDVALSKAADLTPDHGDVGVTSRTAPFIISTASVDRDGDTLDVNGWDLADYEKNPIVLFDHNPAQPIGKSISIFVKDQALRAVAWFADRDTSELADTVFKLIQADVLRTASVTFLPLEYTQAADRAPMSAWGAPPMNFKKQKLLEWSVVSVPSNQDALLQAKGLKVDWRTYGQFIEQQIDEAKASPSNHPLSAPRAEYEKTYAVVKSFLPSSPAKSVTAPTPKDVPEMKVQKGGRVLSQANADKLKEAMQHAGAAQAAHQKCMAAMKAIMDAHSKDDGDADEDDVEDSEQDGESKGNVTGVEQEITDHEADLDSKPEPTPSVTIPGKPTKPAGKSAGAAEQKLLERARAAIGLAEQKAAVEVSIAEANFTDADFEAAMKLVIDRQHAKHLRALRGQD